MRDVHNEAMVQPAGEGEHDSTAGRRDGDRPTGLRRAIAGVEGALGAGAERAEEVERSLVPAWRRVTEGERRWPVCLAVLVAIALQLYLPDRLALHPRWLLAAVEVTLLVGVVITNPQRMNRRSNTIRAVSIALTLAVSIGNAWSAGHLIHAIVTSTAGDTAGPLLADGGAIWVTNVIVFGLWYWQLDRGGPAARAHGERIYPDFQFPQMDSPDLAPPDWEPEFWDYLYVSFTNATAFSPTDALPLTRWTKMAMALQSAVSLSTLALVVARAVNILK